MSTKNTTTGLKELRENMEVYINKVKNGESVTVFRRSTPLFRLVPVESEESGWETVVDFTELTPEGVSGRDVLTAIKQMHG